MRTNPRAYKLFSAISSFHLYLLAVVLLTANMAFADEPFTATTLGDYGNVSVMEVSGNYDAKNPDGTVNAAPRLTIAKEFFRTHKDEYDFSTRSRFCKACHPEVVELLKSLFLTCIFRVTC